LNFFKLNILLEYESLQLEKLEKDRGSTLTISTHTGPAERSRWSFPPMFEVKVRRYRIMGKFVEIKRG
jgi:hypothetical protein